VKLAGLHIPQGSAADPTALPAGSADSLYFPQESSSDRLYQVFLKRTLSTLCARFEKSVLSLSAK